MPPDVDRSPSPHPVPLTRAVPRWTRADRFEAAVVAVIGGGVVVFLAFFAGLGISFYVVHP